MTPLVEPTTTYDLSGAGMPDTYRLMIEAIVPRPIALVSTVNAHGQGNLAPFSYFNAVATNPASLSISIVHKRGGGKKDTLRNIEETGQFVVNSFNHWILDAAHQTSGEYAYGIDEMREAGLTPLPSQRVKPFRVAESGLQMECEVYKLVEVGDGSPGSTTLVIGKILLMHVQNRVLRDGHIDPKLLDPMARLGGDSYTRLGELIDRPRAQIVPKNS